MLSLLPTRIFRQKEHESLTASPIRNATLHSQPSRLASFTSQFCFRVLYAVFVNCVENCELADRSVLRRNGYLY